LRRLPLDLGCLNRIGWPDGEIGLVHLDAVGERTGASSRVSLCASMCLGVSLREGVCSHLPAMGCLGENMAPARHAVIHQSRIG
jgi:hypothetical protein